MSKPRKVHLFNCDRTYKFDAVEGLLEATKAKVGSYSADRHYFSLAQLSEMTTKTIPKLDMDMAFFVVHAHESRLSINEDNAGIGYAKIYRALLEATGGNVIIVIGGDDNYKNEDEEDQVVISRWAKRKISSQFKEEFLDGRKSFIFSWNKQHRAIHEEALLHFLDPSKKGLKFEYQPKPKEGKGNKSAQSLRRGQSMDEERREGSSFIPSDKAGQKRETFSRSNTYSGGLSREDSSSSPFNSAGQRSEDKWPQQRSLGYDSPQDRATSSSHTTGVFHPVQSDANFRQETGEMYQPPSHATGRFNPLQSHANSAEQGREDGAFTANTNYLISQRGASHEEKPASSTMPKDLAILGCNVTEDSMKAVMQVFADIAPKLNLAEQPAVENLQPDEAKRFLTRNLLKFCVLVVDVNTVDDAYNNKLQQTYKELLETAANEVVVKVIVLVCDNCVLPQKDEAQVHDTIERIITKTKKGFIAWFKHGKLAVDADVLVQLMNPTSAEPQRNPQTTGVSRSFEKSTTYLDQPQGYQMRNPSEWETEHGWSEQSHTQQAQGTATISPAINWGPVVLKSKLHNGMISRKPGDVQIWYPGFVVPAHINQSLLHKHENTPEAVVKIVKDRNGELQVIVEERSKDCSKDQEIELAANETIMLETRVRYGQASLEKGDLKWIYPNFQIPSYIMASLKRKYETLPNGELYVISDDQGNLRYKVQIEKIDKVREWGTKAWRKVRNKQS